MSTERKRVVYVAGPYRAATERGVALNIQRAERVALCVWACGAVAFCPHKNTAHFGGALPDTAWLEGGLEMVRRCDALVLVDGGEKSEGTKAEKALAEELGLPVFHQSDLNDWDKFSHWVRTGEVLPAPIATGGFVTDAEMERARARLRAVSERTCPACGVQAGYIDHLMHNECRACGHKVDLPAAIVAMQTSD